MSSGILCVLSFPDRQFPLVIGIVNSPHLLVMGHTRLNLHPPLTRRLIELGVFRHNAVGICDVGARGGLEPQWQVFGAQAALIGFEPDAAECDRLNQTYAQRRNQSATFPPVTVYPVALGHRREQRRFYECRYPGGSSFYPADMDFIRRFPAAHAQQLQVVNTVDIETISLDEFAQQQPLPAIDFLKLDVEGSELDILQGAKTTLQNGVLGLSLEVLFHADMRHQPPFYAIDQFLQSLGFRLFDLETYRYARRTLSLPMGALGETAIGQMLWGQALYFRDPVAALQSAPGVVPAFWTPQRCLKLASLMEIFRLPDCALEVLQQYATPLATMLNLDVEALAQCLLAPDTSSAQPAPSLPPAS